MRGLSLKAKITIIIPLGVAVVTALGALLIEQRVESDLRQLIQEQQSSSVAQVVSETVRYSTILANETLRKTLAGLWGGIAALMVMSALAAHLLARRFMQPVVSLAAEARALREKISGGRLAVSSDPEVRDLAQAFNALLDEQEQRQQEKERNALLLATLLDTMPNPVFYKDGAGRYIGCNRAFEQAIGITRANLLGKTVYDIAPADKAAVYDQADRDLLRTGGTQQYESTVLYADNTEHTVMFVKATFDLEDGRIGGLLGTYLDFTALKESERALSRQKKFTDSLLQNATVAIFVIDRSHRVKIWNQACEELTGISANEMMETDEHWRGFYCEKRPCLADLVLDQQFDANTTYYETYRRSPINPEGMQAEGWFTLRGVRRYILFNAAPIRDENGQIIAAIETLEEITYRKEQEEELSAVARAVSIAGGDGFFSAVAHYIGKTLGTDYLLIGSIDEQNPQQATTLAVAAKDGFLPNFTYQLNESPCRGIMNGSICCYTENVRILFPQDHLLQEKGVEGYIAMPLLGSGRVPLGILVAMHRSSIQNPERARSLMKIFAARTAAELQRKLDEDRLRKLSYAVAQSPASIVITDTQGRIEFVNPKFSRVTGYSADEIIGKTPAILKSGETPATVYHELWDAIEHGSQWEGVFHNRRKDGELYWERAYISPIKDDHGVITNYMCIKEDISEQKRLEGALRHAQKMEAVGQLAGGIAHDFNNILTAVIGYASILEISAGQDAQMNNGVQQIIKAAERGANLTKSLLAFSRRQAANIQTADLNEIVVRSEKLLCHLINETVELKIVLQSSPLMVNVDSMELEQVLMNLITNSRDAMPRGGVITLETGQATVDHQFIKEHGFGIPGQYAMLNVTDTGSGMDQKTSEKIFEPFFTTKENGKGTGLGLAIVYNIIKSHKGNIVCTSKPGDGTRFTIYLPQLTADLAPAVESTVGLVRRGHELVLLVEDETEIRELMRQFLVDYGYRVIVAADGAEAIVKFNEKPDEIALAVLDAGLPRVSGSDALAAMRQQRPALKGIIVSGYANNTRITEETGQITRFLAKPMGPADLVRAVREELDR